MLKFVQKIVLPIAGASLVALGVPGIAGAQEHVVSTQELRKDVAASAKTRGANEAKLERFLTTPAAREAMRKTGVDYKTVQKGVRTLSDAELAQLAARTDKAQAAFSAGLIGFAELLLIAIAVIVIVVVVAAA
jgi:pyruvate/2-oxoglutarate dehydrogenase complex dihydrolipoamide acyltransferase (E2) component